VSILEFSILSLLFLLSVSLIYSSLRAGITPVPSSRKARDTILAATELAAAGPILELGSGWGHLALALAKKYPQRQVIGYELSFVPWLFSLCWQKLSGTRNLELRFGNFLAAELPAATLLVCYLYPGGMTQLADKLIPGKHELLISNTFALPEYPAEQVIRLDDLYKSPIYVYRVSERNSEVEK
jgi:hypothetical protein